MRTHSFDSTIAMSIIRMVIYYKALTGSLFSSCRLSCSLLTSPQFNLTRTPTSNVPSNTLSPFLCRLSSLIIARRYYHPNLLLLLARGGSWSLRRLLAGPVRPPPLRKGPQHFPKCLQPCNTWLARVRRQSKLAQIGCSVLPFARPRSR